MELKSIFEIEKAFQYTKWISIISMIISLIICFYAFYAINKAHKQVHKYIYVAIDDQLVEARKVEDEKSIQALAHVNHFHQLFFRLHPDKEQIERNINQSLHLIDRSGYEVYNQLKESGFYKNLISGSISTDIIKDSIYFSMDKPNTILFKGRQKIIRPTTITFRNLVTSTYVRMTEPTSQNPYGFIMERWNIIDNEDIRTIRR